MGSRSNYHIVTAIPAQTPFTSQVPGAATMNSDKPFVFSGNKITTPQVGTSAVKVAGAPGKGVPGVAIAGLVVVLLVVWGVFWAKLLGLF